MRQVLVTCIAEYVCPKERNLVAAPAICNYNMTELTYGYLFVRTLELHKFEKGAIRQLTGVFS
jgi:hypothetical protein